MKIIFKKWRVFWTQLCPFPECDNSQQIFSIKVLTPEEKRFVLLVERGDCASVAKLVKVFKYKYHLFDINCLDPLGRSALSIAIINENPEMMELLLEEGIQVS